MKKVVLKLELHDDRIKQKAMKAVSGLSGVESVSVDMQDNKMTVTGDIDPVNVVGKLRKLCPTEVLSFGPAKDDKNPDDKKPDSKLPYEVYDYCYYPLRPQYYCARSVEEDSTVCVIC